MSKTRKLYFARLFARILILFVCIFLYFFAPQSFKILEGLEFFNSLSPFHLLWIIWVFDMIAQIFPIKSKLALGSLKLFSNRFRPVRDKISAQALRNHIVSTTKSAYRVMIIWVLLVAAIGALRLLGIIDKPTVFLISVLFYVCDLICVLVWCPFRLIMKNKCCTTCRIFNWDHFMMFSPLVFVGGFFALSLFFLSLIAWLVWEISIMLYPERFCEATNASLKCSECTDKLCTQYCQKLRN
ncbi:MAG: hypothetical protein IJY88_06665 [Clostridia bacterium]|nr:hypothetical protein [Clostridia bacterium]